LDTKNIDMKNLMTKEEVQKIVDEVYPKIEKHYGISKFHECTPWVELHHNIYLRIIGEDLEMGEDDYPTEVEEFGEADPAAEFDRECNTIVVYHPKMKNRQEVIETLIHEYQHHLQSPLWMKRYYNMGHTYDTHPYEVEATSKEKEWVLFN
jgi:hypothetical protein